MLVIRLQRVGKKNQASFRVVLQEKTWSPKGKAKELLGFYNPVSKEKAFQKERIAYWIQKGAEPSPTVHNMFIDEGILQGSKIKAWQPKKKEKPAATEAPTTPAGEPAKEEATATTPEEVAPETEKAVEEKPAETREDAPNNAEVTEPQPESAEEKPSEEPKKEEEVKAQEETKEEVAEGKTE